MNISATHIINILPRYIGKTGRDVGRELSHDDDAFDFWWSLEWSNYLAYAEITPVNVKLIIAEIKEKDC